MNDTILNNYQRWTERAIADVDVINELKDIAENEEKIEDAFYKDLAFGTGGLRGVIGAGTNRLNVYTVAKASQGLADYVIKNFAPEKRKIAVSFDSRIKSDVFAKVASGVFAANGIKVEIYSELMPTPCLSFAVRYLGCAAGVMVTASHNPAKYNGYKVYGADGCQITTEAAAEILAEIEKLDIFDDVKRISFEEGFEAGKISYISEEVYTAFVEAVKKESVLGDTQVNKDVAIVYAEYGYCLNTLHSYTFEGSAGFEKMQNIMVSFRKSITEFAGKKVLKCLDYSEGIDGLPKSDVLKFFLEDNCSIVVRPSGTEPKLKAYISVSATTKEEAQVVEGKLARAVEEKM